MVSALPLDGFALSTGGALFSLDGLAFAKLAFARGGGFAQLGFEASGGQVEGAWLFGGVG